MDKLQAKTIAQQYAEKSEVIIVTSDNSVFFGPQKYAAEFHAKEKNLQLFTFTKGELIGGAQSASVENSEEIKEGDGAVDEQKKETPKGKNKKH